MAEEWTDWACFPFQNEQKLVPSQPVEHFCSVSGGRAVDLRDPSLKKIPAGLGGRVCIVRCYRERACQIPEVFTVMSVPGGWGGVGFPQSDPPRLWGDSLFLGFRGGAGICSLSWILLPLALGFLNFSSH